MSVNYGAPAGAIPRRSPAIATTQGRAADLSDPARKEISASSEEWFCDRNDPLGLRETWIRARASVRKLVEKEKKNSLVRQQIRGDRDPFCSGIVKIKARMELLRQDLGIGISIGNQESEGNDCDPLWRADPPDKGKGGNHPREGRGSGADGESHHTINQPIQAQGKQGSMSIKVHEEESSITQSARRAVTTNPLSAMAGQDQRKNKAVMDASEEVTSNGKPGMGHRPLLRGGSSRGRGDGFRTPVGQGVTGIQAARYDEREQVVAPVFPVSMEIQAPNVVQLNLARERTAMRSRWIAVGLFFSVQVFGFVGLFNELKSKWGLRGRLNYTPMKNNRFLLEFEREGDLRFILNNGPCTQKGDAFLMVAVDGSARPGDVEVAHMAMWARIYDAPPIMLFESVARELGAELGEVLEVDADSEGRIWGNYMRVRVNHDVDEPIRSKLESYDSTEGKWYELNVKYERLPRFCSSCGHLGHSQRDCKLPEDLQEMRYSAAMRASPFKRSSSRGGVIVPEASSARRFLLFDSEAKGTPVEATKRSLVVRPGMVPEEVLADPLVQEAIEAVSALCLDAGRNGGPAEALKSKDAIAANIIQAGAMSDGDKTPRG
ncbi:uncharacterized protein [Triticum aestivum]|uniref:uncharacterized protein n=1 Tax=Triticum aestivum TaxID=4565 RepID=UPI001D0357FE|nr:uncharacterized protein LOC123153501 [Triticum aestivum]